MSLLFLILLFNFIGSVLSLVGGFLLVIKKSISSKTTHLLSSFAAGALLGAVFFDLLPEGLHEATLIGIGNNVMFSIVLVGILSFFLLERYLHWFHHHEYSEKEITGKPIVPLIVIGDSIHNFVDGAAIAATFMVSIPLGILTTFAVAVHEIPQEIGDFGILLHQKVKRKKIILINLLSSLFSILGAIFAFLLGESFGFFTVLLLGFSAGLFLYIALSDLVPEIHNENKRGKAFGETLCLFLGVLVVYLGLFIIENVFHITP